MFLNILEEISFFAQFSDTSTLC